MRKVRLAGELRSAVEARRLVEEELGLAGAGEDTMLHTQLVATELVTNAARHAQTPVELTIVTAVGRVRVEARDASAATLTPHVDTQTRHRGLQLIEDLSDGWGVDAQDAAARSSGASYPAGGSPAKRRSSASSSPAAPT